MNTPTPRRRAVASLVALPLVFAVTPFTGVAAAATTASFTAISVPGNKVGPNAGYLDSAQGVAGTTAIARISLSDDDVTLQQIVVNVSGPSISVFRDFATNDGFALYKDLGAAGFTTEDHAAGPVSDGIRAGAPSGGRTPLTITTNPEKATGSSAYFLTVHPATVDIGDRPFTVSIDANALTTSDAATTSPAITLPTLTIDSRPPSAPKSQNFVPTQRVAGQEDGFTVSNERTETDKFLAFYNSSTDVALNTLLVRPDGSYAVAQAPPFPAEVKIGDGTGRSRSVTVAQNNQTSNFVYVRAVDSAGNLTAAITAGLNDVTAPEYSAWNLTIPTVNASNQAAVPITTNGTASGDFGVAGEMLRLVGLDVNGSHVGFTPWKAITRSSYSQPSPAPTIDARPLGTTPTRIVAQSQLIDPYNNIQDIHTGTPSPLDLTRPQLIAVAPVLDAGAAGPTPEDKYRVFFSEPILQTTITDTNGTRTACTTSSGGCVNNRLKLAAGDGSATAVNWGLDPGFDWAADGMSATITLGTEQAVAGPNGPVGTRLPRLGDIVSADAAIRDLGDNTVPNSVKILDPGLLPTVASTLDTGGGALFNQNVDGRIDAVDITMSGNLLPASLAPDNFRVTGSAGPIVPSALTTSDNKTIRLHLPTSTMLTGELPIVSLVEPEPGAGTGLRGADNRPVGPFSILAIDKAPPALIGAKTRDGDGDGHIDSIEMKFSEAIDHGREVDSGPSGTVSVGYKVPGYENGTSPNQVNNDTNNPSAPSDTTIVNLKEKEADFDTEVVPPFSYTSTRRDQTPLPQVRIPGDDICDAFFNCRTSFSSTLTDPYFDAAAPVVVNRRTLDLDSDGFVDAVGAQFSEPMRTETISNALFSVEGRTVTAVVPVFVGNPDALYVRIAEATGEGDTATKLKLQYTGGPDGGAHDAAVPTSNPAKADAAAVESLDGAGPAIYAATFHNDGPGPGDGTKVRILLSEPTVEMVIGDFKVAGISKATNQSVIQEPTELTIADDKKSVILTLGTAIDPMFDGTVEFSAAGAVSDEATPPNLSTQTSPVPLPPFPIALLDAKGPVGSSPGFSTSRTFDTGAAGNSGVSAWCLKAANLAIEGEPTAPTSADDPCFKLETPATHTVPIDGPYRLLLVTKNHFGNMSTPATDTITVDTAGPVAESVILERLGMGRTGTVRDNDQIRVVLSTSGSSPQSFTATADYTALTGNPADTAVPAFSRNGGTFNFPFRFASGTTVYPVGTTLAVNGDSGQPFILEDGPDGKVVKRRFLSAQAMSTYRIPSNLVIRVPSTVVNPIPTGETKYYRDGQLVRASNSPAVFVMTDDEKRAVPSRAVFEAMGYDFRSVVVVPPADLARVPTGDNLGSDEVHPAGSFVRNNTRGHVDFGKTYVILRDADGDFVKRHVVSSTALLSHITINQVVNLPHDHKSLAVPTDALKRGMRDGMLVREPNDPRVFAVSRGARRHINSRGAFDLMGFSFRNVVVVGPEHIGIPVNSTVPVGTRRVPFSVTVRDQAGNHDTRDSTVVGLGIPEPLPPTAPGAPRP